MATMPGDLAQTMKAYRVVDWERPPEVVEMAVPRPGPGEVLVKVAGNGLCHSDLVMPKMPKAVGEMLGWSMPFTLGHEVGGHVAAVGTGVTSVQDGDPVAVISASSCGACWYCLRGIDNACDNGLAGRGYGRDGGLADYLLVSSERLIVKLKTLDPAIAGPLTDAGSTSYHAVKRVLPKLVPGSSAVVFGAGGLGSYAVQFLRALSPATVVVVDQSAHRRTVAQRLGAHHVFDGVDKTTTATLRDLTNGRGVDAVIDFVGIDLSITAGMAALAKAGSYALVGSNGGRFTKPIYGNIPRNADLFTFQGGCISDTREVIELAEAGLIEVAIDRFNFDQIELAYEKMEAGELTGRAVIMVSTDLRSADASL
jgi:alcohol dehydrogenase, propanol-preferring